MRMEGTQSGEKKKKGPDDGLKGDQNMLPVICNT